MTIQWYPGHMAKTKRKIQEDLKLIDVVIELLDARIPISSKNPEIDSLIKGKPKVILLNKSDMSDPRSNELWGHYYDENKQDYIYTNSITGKGIKELITAIEKKMAHVIERDLKKGRINRQIKCMILGIPNVGKSTLINTMAGRASAKTGNLPGVTRSNQWIKVSQRILLLDTPGILWPKFEDPIVGLKLAWIGSIKETIYDREDAALKLISFLRESYEHCLIERYNIDINPSDEDIDIYEKIAQKRGFIQKGGNIDYSRTAEMLLDELKKTKIGKISFENP
ncbi:ribosome biogenesis GTPase YlqF [Alkalibaculum sp. M08DMB]|uniref:Ribosome biogenesis GTPase A n=1 Tax=Alkalibaculum sporogenes TaxID=2655001 RepID=A0A6A7K9M8_9FIRM|nr:ribosome biogenesis GTPase YlqF [Alkalibaculum sporogenes]MPW26065.1 ribosome biogenesis GTPase YlqF [Alkalibaculum sporogenes]